MNPDTAARTSIKGDPTAADTVIDLWFGAAVWCDTTRVGTVCGFVCSTLSPHMHEVIVRDDAHGHAEHPVALRDIGNGTERRDVAVTLSPDDVRSRTCATETVLVDDVDQLWWADVETGRYDEWTLHPEPVHIPVVVPKLEDGDALVRAHAAVYVERHHVGRLSGLQADRATGRVTACIVDVGHRWHHRHVLVPASAIEELSEAIVWVRGSRQELTHLPSPHDRTADDLVASEPHDVGVDDRDPDGAHIEAAHVLADQVHDALRARGFTNSEILHWADAYTRAEHSGDADGFLEWTDTQEHRR